MCVVQVDSLQEMDAKIDSMAQSGALDPALLLTLAKAHTSVKDTDYTREEVKDVMAHLYFKVSSPHATAVLQLPGSLFAHLTPPACLSETALVMSMLVRSCCTEHLQN